MSNPTKTFTYIIGIIMTVAMVGSLILPMLSNQVAMSSPETASEQPTAPPPPTMPPPPDLDALAFEKVYLHESGLFTMRAPEGWLPVSGNNSPSELRANLSNSAAQSIIEARISANPSGIADAAALSEYLDSSWFGASWGGYSSWDETSRKTTDDGIVQVDFNLTRGYARLIARQESWLEDGDIYSVRVVLPENAAEELKFILQEVGQSIEALPIYAGAPFGWAVYFDNSDKHIIRYPGEWQLSDGADGLPATIVGDGFTLRTAAFDTTLESEAAARAWLESTRPGLQALSAQTADVEGFSGYKVSYNLRNIDGDEESGLALMLHGSDDRLHVANLRSSTVSEDLLQADAAILPWLAAIDNFRLVPDFSVDLQ